MTRAGRGTRSSLTICTWPNSSGSISVCQWHDFHLADADFAAGIMLLEGEVSLLEGLREIQVLIQFVAIDGDLDPGHLATAPDVVAHFQFVGEPRVRLHELLIDVTESVQRPGAN